MWPLKTILYFSLFWVGCFAALINPIWGVVNYMMAYQMHPPETWWGQPLVALGLRFSMLAAVFTVVGLFVARRRVPQCRPIISFWEGGVLLLLFIAVLNIMFGIGFGPRAQYAFEKFWKLHVFVMLLARLAITRRNLHLVIWSIVAGSFYLGYDAYTAPYHAFLVGRLEGFGGPDIATSSGASAHLAAMLPIIGIAFLIAKSRKARIWAAVSGALTFNAIVLCRTRSAFLGLLVGAAVAILMAPKAKRFRIYVLMGGGLVAAFSLTDSHYMERMATLFDGPKLRADQAATSRFDIWRAGWLMLADYPTGVGLGNFSHMIGRYDVRYINRSPHNTVVMAFCELGLMGGFVFLVLLFESIRLLYRCTRVANVGEHVLETKIIAYGFLVSIVTYFVASLGTERFSCESFWWVMVFPLCLYRIVVAESWSRQEACESVEQPALAGHRAWDGTIGYAT